MEAPREAALLLKELWTLTTVPFAAADALLGYMLTTFMEEPTTGQLALISSTIPGLDLYFNKYTLLGIPPPANLPVAMAPVASAAPPLPPGSPPHAPAPTQPPAPMPVSHSPAEAGHDIFAKFISALQASGRTPDAAFAAADVNRDGRLSSAELAAAVMGMVPGASEIDRKHFQVLLDTDYEDGMVTQ